MKRLAQIILPLALVIDAGANAAGADLAGRVEREIVAETMRPEATITVIQSGRYLIISIVSGETDSRAHGIEAKRIIQRLERSDLEDEVHGLFGVHIDYVSKGSYQHGVDSFDFGRNDAGRLELHSN